MAKNYYLILGVAPDASQDQIKHAYRRKALELHPDHHGHDAEPFLEAQEAYGVLSNPPMRKEYDRSLQSGQRATVRRGPAPEVIQSRRPQVEPLVPEPSPVELEDVSLRRSFQTCSPSFEDLFDHLWSNFAGRAPPKAEKLESLTIDVPVSFQQAMAGGRARVLVPAVARCSACAGSGGMGPFECLRCAGEGVVAEEYPVSVAFPPGIPNDYAVSLPLNRLGIHNLYLTVRFRLVGR
jgi:molecular chaperone DnaJ